MRLDWLADVARAAGLLVVEVENWRTRGRDYTETPVVWLFHHTAESISSGDAGGLRIVTYGREGLAGPIANYYLSRSGIVYVVAAGVANNAGTGNARAAGLPLEAENEDTIAVEMANNGIGEPYSPAMYTAAMKLAAAVHRKMGWPASRAIGHKEWSTTGKIDPLWNMTTARQDLATVMAGGSPTPAEDDMTPEEMKLARLNIPKVAGPSTSSLRSDIAATDAWTLALLNAEYAARGVDALKAAVSGIETVVMLTPEQLAELSENVAASVVAADNSLTEEDLPAIKEQVKQAMREGTAPPASTVEP